MNIKKSINWKVFFVLLSASAFSILAVMPYIISLQGDVLRAAPIPFPVVILITIFQSVLMFAFFIFIGLRLSNKIGLGLPIIERLVDKKNIDFDLKPTIKKSIIFGILVGIIIILLDFAFFQFGLERIFKQISVPVWQGFLASFYGGISEEIVMRLFFMTFIIWLISKIKRTGSKIIENNLEVWTSIFIASILFGIGHLPVTSELMDLTPLVVFRSLLLNGVGGVVFGWLYWKKGLESAMIAHFSADIVLHVCLPLVLIIL